MEPHLSTRFMMKELNSDIEDYIQKRSKSNLESIHNQLMSLATINDLTVFDLKEHATLKFFINLYDLLSFIDVNSTTTWFCIEVLINACRNQATRTSLIANFNFIPALSRFLGNHLKTEKKKMLLSILRDLSCGIKITWPIPQICDLIRTISEWVDVSSQDEEIVSLSLTILVNLCYKNTAAMYILTRQIDVKKFLRTCISLTGPALEMNTCKLLVIFDSMNNQISPEIFFKKLIVNTFKSVVDISQNSIVVDQTVQFFMDICERDVYKESLKSYRFKERMDYIKNRDLTEIIDEPERLTALMKFLNYLLEHAYSQLNDYHSFLMDLSVNCIENQTCLCPALQLFTILTLHGYEVLEKIGNKLPMFISVLQDTKSATIIAVIKLLRALLSKHGRDVLVNLKDIINFPIFQNLLTDNDLNNDNVTLYLNVIALVQDLSAYDAKWKEIHSVYQEKKNVHQIVALALLNGEEDVKKIAIETSTSFSPDFIAKAIGELKLNENSTETGWKMNEMLSAPTTAAQSELLDQTLNRLKCAKFDENVLVSDIMELYEYKLSELSYAERTAKMSANLAYEQCNKERNRVILLDSQVNQMRQLLYHKQKQLEDATRINGVLQRDYKEITNKFEAERGRLNVTRKNLIEVTAVKDSLEEENAKLSHRLGIVESNLHKANNYEKKLSEEIIEWQRKYKELQNDLADKNRELDKIKNEFREKITIIDSIVKLTSTLNGSND